MARLIGRTLAAGLAMGAIPALAATQGDAGARSSGSIRILASVVAQARISESAAQPCVRMNTATQGFDVTADPVAAAELLGACDRAPTHTGLNRVARPDGTASLIVIPE